MRPLRIEGKIEPEVYERWNCAAGGKKLPERVRKKAPRKKPRKKAFRKKPRR